MDLETELWKSRLSEPEINKLRLMRTIVGEDFGEVEVVRDFTRFNRACTVKSPEQSAGLSGRTEYFERILSETVACAVGHIVLADGEQLEQLSRDDAAMSRAIYFTGSFQVVGNVLGENRKRYVSDWIDQSSVDYDIKREAVWDAEFPSKTPQTQPFRFAPPGAPQPGEEEFSDRFQNSRHSQLKTLSLIREQLWIKAQRQGLGFVGVPGSLPILALVFGQREPANRIFSLWEEELGKRDEAELLRITIIRHMDKSNPHHYRVVIGSNIDRAGLKRGNAVFSVARIHTMTPGSSQNLETFLQVYRDVGAYLVAPAVVSNDQFSEAIGNLGIMKCELIVKEAWEIGRNDPDGVGLLSGDKPVIPAGMTDPPVNELLKWKVNKERERKPNATHRKSSSSHAQSLREKRKKEKRKRQQARKSRRK